MTPDYLLRIVAAIVAGGLIGLEREVRDKPAGFRTIILICVGACVFTIVSEISGSLDHERTRIAAQIVSGIGFLGAGAILHGRGSVIGVTTAATIWAVAAVGMAVGFGHYVIAGAATLAVLISLHVFDYVEQWVGDRYDIQQYAIATENCEDAPDRIEHVFAEHQLAIRKQTCHQDGDLLVVQVVAMGSKGAHDRLHRQLVRSNEYTLRPA